MRPGASRPTRPRARSARSPTWRRHPVKRSSVLLALVLSCHRGEEEQPPAGVAVVTAKVSRGDVSAPAQAAGELTALPGADVKLGPLVAGRLGEVLAAEGDRVQKGQLLARLDLTSLRDTAQQAEAQLAQARAQESNAS